MFHADHLRQQVEPSHPSFLIVDVLRMTVLEIYI